MVQFFIMCLVMHSYKTHQERLRNASIVSIILSTVLYFVITYYFFSIYSQIVKINKAELQYYIDNDCSSTIVLYSIQQVLDKISNMSVYALLGGLLTTILLVGEILATLDSFGFIKKCRKGHNEDF
jgi:hypothetical protein